MRCFLYQIFDRYRRGQDITILSVRSHRIPEVHFQGQPRYHKAVKAADKYGSRSGRSPKYCNSLFPAPYPDKHELRQYIPHDQKQATDDHHQGRLYRQNIAHHDRAASEGDHKSLRQRNPIEDHGGDRNGDPGASRDSKYQKIQHEHPDDVEYRIFRQYRCKISCHKLKHDIRKHR